ncbi:MAG: transcriptional repressor LexA [bacterium]
MEIGERIRRLQEFYFAHRRMPSYAELARLFNFRSKNAVFRLVERLRQLKVIDKDKTGKLIPQNLTLSLKLLGTVEAGFPSPAEEELLDRVSLDRWLITNSNATFLLKVTGDSMANAGILPGDAVLVDRSLTPKNGDIVVAEVDGAWTMKFFYKEKGVVVLRAANPKYPPIKPRQELKLGGVVTAVIRKYR